MDFGDLKDDKPIQEKLINFHNSVEKISQMLQLIINSDIYEKLSVKEKVEYDLFRAYTLNTLYWLYLRNRNEDPNKNDIKNQLNRIKDCMIKAKQVNKCIYVVCNFFLCNHTKRELWFIFSHTTI